MKAVVCTSYGPPEVLQLVEVEKPIPKKDQVLIKVKATAVTASDCIIRSFKMPGAVRFPQKQFMELMMRVFIGFTKPRNPLGLVLSGEIVSVGTNIKRFNKGDQVYGWTGFAMGAYTEFVCMSEEDSNRGCLAIKPSNMSYQEAAALSYGAVLASHFLNSDNTFNGRMLLIYGASGAIGTIAVQLAKCHGAQVTAVCSSENIELVRSLGADRVIDYTKKDSAKLLEIYDLVLDAVGKNKTSELKVQCEKALTADGRYVSVDDSNVPLRSEYLDQVREFVEAGDLQVIIDRCYTLEEIVEAHTYVDQGHKKGNVVITL
ncbi:MAG: NAD(P)-dependent alcohol dehydrogenase [Gammaproteobacteria bacterium]|nr:NAD(P)-dependent alcohol dehydrogenase [Gammaproteobacteria bacterium]